jgi:hypothetical protein
VFDEKKKPGGMLQELKVAVGTRVMMTTNVNTADGLVNSASGTVTGLCPLSTNFPVLHIYFMDRH